LLIWCQAVVGSTDWQFATIAILQQDDRREFCCIHRSASNKSWVSSSIGDGINVVSNAAMPRGPRLNVVNGIYHVMARGNRKAIIFEDDHDRRRFIDILIDALEHYAVRVFHECRLGNHYHLIVQTPRANLPHFMGYLNGGYSRYSNARHHRIGHLFNERYKPVLVESNFHLRIAAGYVAMNPVNHGFVPTPAEWRWSSYRATVGMEDSPEYLCLDWLDSAFPSSCRAESRVRYAEYLRAPTVAEGWNHGPVFGSSGLEHDLRQHIGANLFMASLPRSYRALNRPPLEALFSWLMTREDRNQQILRAHVLHAYTMSEIARALNMNPASVSRIVATIRRRARESSGTPTGTISTKC
jgi:putative transposase